MPDSGIPLYSYTPGPPAKPWTARWISHPSAHENPTGVYLFRKFISLDSAPDTFRVRISADNRYSLFVNGQRAAEGPSRCDIQHWTYRVLDLAPYLKQGRNILAVKNWFFDRSLAPWAQVGLEPAFLLSGLPDDPLAELANTTEGWKCVRDTSYIFHSQWVTGPVEVVNASLYPWGWETEGFDDSHWLLPTVGLPGCPRGVRDAPSNVWLVPDTLPLQEASKQPLTNVVRTEGISPVNALSAASPVIIPTHTRAHLLLDRGYLTTIYPELTVEGGAGSIVRMRYAEALVDDRGQKGDRNQVQGRHCPGIIDTFLPDGPRRLYRPLWWRTCRYLQIEVETAETPLTMLGIDGVFTAYPFEEKGKFESSDSSLKHIWEVGWRTARLCAHETYMDCPYYEQLQYGGDTRIQCMVSLYVAGDDRLIKNAIAQLDYSRLPEGITQSRYPCHNTQMIPPFALSWVGILHDYWMYRDDHDFVQSMLPGARATLEWFTRMLDVHMLLGPLPWWNFADWASDFPDGVPAGASEGGSSIISLQFVLALQEMAKMEQNLGKREYSHMYESLASQIIRAVMKECWSEARGLLADTPAKIHFSQHANALGILAFAFSPHQKETVSAKLLTEPMSQATYYFRYYLHKALCKAGLADHYLEWLQPWSDMLALHLSTWAENPEPTRSDCHAWSAHPNADLLATVLGVEPLEPGFARVLVEPHSGRLEWVKGVVPHPNGVIEVKVERESERLSVEITLPKGVTGVFRNGARDIPLKAGHQRLNA